MLTTGGVGVIRISKEEGETVVLCASYDFQMSEPVSTPG